MTKRRLDVFLVDTGLFPSRKKAQEAIESKLVKVDGKIVLKSSFYITGNEKIETDFPESMKYVSRGGLKLEKALKSFDVSPKDKVILDAGASTGGFTDCLLKKGAAKIWAVDVGEGQLHETLKDNSKIISIEKFNIKDLKLKDLDNISPDLIVADLSFISLAHVLEVFSELLAPDGLIITLIKPQFEAGQEHISKGGIVKDRAIHKKVIQNLSKIAHKYKLYLNKLDSAPVYDSFKNVEYLGLFSHTETALPDINKVVNSA
ncbi:MAG: TlyA family RNA methyltransferase [Bacteroidales bacterium]